MKSGIYALASLDGAPLQPADMQALGLDAQPDGKLLVLEGLRCTVADNEEGGRAVDVYRQGDQLLVLLGYLDEADELSKRLGLTPGQPSARIALAAVERFQDDAAAEMLGEWSLLHWQGARRELTLLASEACRNPMVFACDGRRIAVAPSIKKMAQLSWVKSTLDQAGMLLAVSRARLRRIMTDETILPGVMRVLPGTRVRFTQDRQVQAKPREAAPPVMWKGSIDEGVDALEKVLRKIMRQHLQRHDKSAILLSGGLDSSLLAWLASQEAGKSEIMFLSSVSPPQSDIPDESEFSQAVANRLGLPISYLCPSPEASIYTPSARFFDRFELPVTSLRHYLYDALYDAARAQGASAVLDGSYGELTLTNHLPMATRKFFVRQQLRQLKAWLKHGAIRDVWPVDAFHVQLSKEALNTLPSAWSQSWHADYEADPLPRLGQPIGIRAAANKNAMTPSVASDGHLRHLMPFRDRRLLRLAAGMPTNFLYHDGMNRALARLMLKGRLPDSVRLRQTTGAFSPDYLVRLKRQAPQALERLESYRSAGAEEWLDLGWLEQTLRTIGKVGAENYHLAIKAQMTTVAAEFFVWWNAATPSDA